MIYMFALVAAIGSTMWFGSCLVRHSYKKTAFAGFVASVCHWWMIHAGGQTVMRSILYTTMIFFCMVFVWLFVEWNHAKPTTKDWSPGTPFWVYFIGGISSCLGVCQLMV